MTGTKLPPLPLHPYPERAVLFLQLHMETGFATAAEHLKVS